MEREYRKQGLTQPLWRNMEALIDVVERYANATGESYYLVTSCTNIARIILDQAPGHALSLTRRALLWAPSDGHAWSVRAAALDCLGRPDLAETVLWEAVRRIPSNVVLSLALAMACVERDGLAEAEALLRKNAALNPTNAPSIVELARVVWLRGHADEALALLYELLDFKGDDNDVALYTLGCLLVAEGQGEKASEALAQYRRTYGQDNKAQTLERLITSGATGQEEIREHLRGPRLHDGDKSQSVTWDAGSTERVLAAECAEFPTLERIGRVAQADLLFSLGEEQRTAALLLVDAALADPADAYAQVVKGLAVPEYRFEMVGRAGRFEGSLPVRLALTPENVAADYWLNLVRRFPEGQHLTHLVQLARGQADDSVHSALAAWCSAPTRWDNGWEKYLKETLRRHLDGNEIPVDLAALAHDALTQAVDVGFDATPLAA